LWAVDFETLNQALGAEIRAWRRHRKMSQERFAEQANVHPNEVRNVELADTNPQLQTLLSIATGMKMSLSGLFGAVEKRVSVGQASGAGGAVREGDA
jgi:transcriptional regulator with XRE-family HTH domain